LSVLNAAFYVLRRISRLFRINKIENTGLTLKVLHKWFNKAVPRFLGLDCMSWVSVL